MINCWWFLKNVHLSVHTVSRLIRTNYFTKFEKHFRTVESELEITAMMTRSLRPNMTKVPGDEVAMIFSYGKFANDQKMKFIVQIMSFCLSEAFWSSYRLF